MRNTGRIKETLKAAQERRDETGGEIIGVLSP
jgi:hypothetical protein